MGKKYLLALPAFNQEDDIKGVISEAKGYDVDILVIDDGSTDDTRKRLSEVDGVYKMYHEKNLGYGRTLINSFRYAMDNCYDFIITMDTDGQHMPAEIPLFIEEAPNCDIVSGSRYLGKTNGGDDDVPPDRLMINREITSTLNAITGFNISDAFCGFKAYDVDSLRKLRLTETGYGMPLQLWIQAWQSGLQVREIQVKLIYNDFTKRFGNGLHDAAVRLKYYKDIVNREVERR